MDYKKIVKAAGYSGASGDYIARKLASRQIPAENLIAVGSYFPKTSELGGVPFDELGKALHEAANKPDKPEPKTVTKAAQTAVQDGDK
jgi:hypothetical protein